MIDVETGGLEPHKNPLLSIGAVEFAKPDNQFYIEIKPFDGLKCHPNPLKLYVHLSGYYDETADDFIQVGTWKIVFKNEYTTTPAEIAKYWLDLFEKFKQWVVSKKTPIIVNITVDLTQLTTEERKQFRNIRLKQV